MLCGAIYLTVTVTAGLNLLLEMLQSFQNSDFATQFHKTYYLNLMQETFAVMTGKTLLVSAYFWKLRCMHACSALVACHSAASALGLYRAFEESVNHFHGLSHMKAYKVSVVRLHPNISCDASILLDSLVHHMEQGNLSQGSAANTPDICVCTCACCICCTMRATNNPASSSCKPTGFDGVGF